MPELTPLDDNRQEHFLNGEDLEPITRREHFYAGRESELPAGHQEPETREEWFIQKYRGGGGDVTVVPLSVTENGTYSEEGKAYSPVSVNVPLPQNAYLLKSVANLPQAIASFNDGEDMVMPSLKVAIEPVQEGSGDPSPTNIRPISGWDAMDVTRRGKNVWGYGIGSPDVTGIYWGWYIPYNTKATIKLYDKGNSGDITNLYFGFTGNGNNPDGGVNWMIRAGVVENTTLETTTQHFISIYQANQEALNKLFNRFNVMVTVNGQPNSTYEPYNGQTYTIDLDGTRYGGEVDVVNGELVVDRIKWTLTPTVSQIAGVSISDCIISIPADKTPVDWNVNVNKCMCNKLKVSNYSAQHDNHVHFPNSSIIALYLEDEIGTTKQEWVDYLAQAQIDVSYIIATPLTIQLTPTAVKSLLGSNNVWADTGDIKDAEYFSKEV